METLAVIESYVNLLKDTIDRLDKNDIVVFTVLVTCFLSYLLALGTVVIFLAIFVVVVDAVV